MLGTSGKYRVETRLGGGGMAEVFLGSMVGAEGFSRKVAIKRVLPGFSDNPAFAQMFVAEAQITARLQHPNIVSVVDFDRDAEGCLFLVMELVEGRDLDALASTGLLPTPLVIYLISEVLRGLGYAHDLPASDSNIRGIIHRDVSPHNVLLSWDGAIKVSDFGIAKARSASAATASVLIKGKPAYMSPEQAKGEPLDGRSDLFAVGVMLWEMLVGRRLFTGEDTRATLAAVLFSQIPRPRSIRPELPKDVERVVMKLLERDLPARYPNAEAAISDLLDCGDAPRSGRELLIKTLGERFPQQAPVRNSVMRSRGGRSDPPQSTQADGSVGRIPVAAMPSLGAARHAATATNNANPHSIRRRSGNRIAVLIAAGLVSAVGAFAIVLMMTKRSKSEPPPEAGSGAVAIVKPPTTPPDGMPDAPPDSPTIDAGVAEVAAPSVQKDAPSTKSGHPATEKKPQGMLSVYAMPTVTVFVDNKKLGDTPQSISLSVGKHQVRLQNGPNGPEELSVTIEANKTFEVKRGIP
jgi:serine/threonine protein kinase